MWKEENLKGEVLELNNIVESLELTNESEFVGALLNFSDYEKYLVEKDRVDVVYNTKETWMAIAEALSVLLELDYTPKGNLQKYADELLNLAKFRIENNIMSDEDFTIPKIIQEVEEKIKVFTKLLYQLKAIDPKTIEETAESFIEKGEAEYQKIMDKTAEKMMKAAESNEEKSIFTDIAKDANESEEVIQNFCYLNGMVDQLGNITTGARLAGYADDNGFTVTGVHYILNKFNAIHNEERKSKSNGLGKAE